MPVEANADVDTLNPSAVAEIRPDDFVALAHLVGGTKSALSPLAIVDGEAATTEQQARLVAQSVLDESGAITPAFLPALVTMANPPLAAEMRLVGEKRLEYRVYFDSDGSPVSLTGLPDAVRIEVPARTDTALRNLEALIGASTVVGTQFAIELESTQALVFAALVDDLRRRLLRALADGRSEPEPPRADAVERELNAPPSSFAGISSVVRGLGASVVPPRDGLRQAVASLTAAGHARTEGSYVQLAPAGEALAWRMLNVQSMLLLRAARDDTNGGHTLIQTTCLIGGLHDVLTIEPEGDGLKMETVSSSQVITFAEIFVNRTAELVATVQSSGQRVDPAALRSCRNCGASVIPQTRFCGVCGAPVQA